MAKLEYTKNSDTSISVKRDDKEIYRGLPLFWAETDGKEVHIRSKIDNQIIINLSTKLGQEDQIIIDGTTYTDLKEATDNLNTFIGLGFKYGGGGSGGGTVIPNKYFFVDQAAADSYFTSNPSELVNGLLVNIAGDYKLWQESTSSWIDATTVVQGPQGTPGAPGKDGKDGKIQSIQQGQGINIDNTDPANPKISATGGGGGGTAEDISVDQSNFQKIYGSNAQRALQSIDDALVGIPAMPAPDDKTYGVKNQQYVEIPPVPTNFVKDVKVNGGSVVDPLDGVAKINWDVPVDGYVPYEADEKSVAALSGGAIVGKTSAGTSKNLARVREEAGTPITELQPGQDVGGTTLNFNGGGKTIDYVPDGIAGGSGSITFYKPSGSNLFISVYFNVGSTYPGGTNIYYRTESGTTTQIYQNDVWVNESINIPAGFVFNTKHINGGGPGGNFEGFVELEQWLTDDSWKPSMALVGGDEQTTIVLGDDTVAAELLGSESHPLYNGKKMALAEDLHDPPQITEEEVTAMFTFSPAVAKPKVRMKKSAFSDPDIEIFVENAGDGTSDLTITAAGGFGAYFDHTGNKAIPIPGINPDSGAGALYPVTITGETDQAQTIITVPSQIQTATIKYTLGKTEAPKASYWIDLEGVAHPFELSNTSMDDLVGQVIDGSAVFTINGVYVEAGDVEQIVFGSSYASVTNIPDNFLNLAYRCFKVDISIFTNVTSYGNGAFSAFPSFWDGYLTIGSIDATKITSVGYNVFAVFINTNSSYLEASSQQVGDIFKEKFPALSRSTIIVNS